MTQAALTREVSVVQSLPKSLTGIDGLDEITGGGLPTGRPTLVCGTAGCGKSLLAIEFVVRGALLYGEPGVIVAFEERPEEITQNVRSLGFDLQQLIAEKKLVMDYVHVERDEIEETGDYDLEGLFVRLGYAIDSIGAKRVVLDTIEALFSGLSNHAILRSELRRLFRFLKDKGVTSIVTSERGDGELTRYGLEEYVSDCVILLDHRVEHQLSTRRLRIVKYRGSVHGADEYPFIIDEHGFSVLPITSLGMDNTASASGERVSSGVLELDRMLGGKGFYRGTTVLVSGTAGTGKTSLAASFAAATCEAGERCLYLAFEESSGQLTRNMRSIGIDLEPCMEKDLLRVYATRPSLSGLEAHLVTMHKLVKEFRPSAVIVDPISNLMAGASLLSTTSMLVRLVDFLKSRNITAYFVSLTGHGANVEQTEVHVSSLVDSWLLVRDVELADRRTRAICVLKSRGMPHSSDIRGFTLTDHGVELRPSLEHEENGGPPKRIAALAV